MIKNLLYPLNIASGAGETIFIALQSWFETIAKQPNGTTLITDSHAFLSDKGFLQVQAAPQKNSAAAKASGEIGLNNFQYELQSFSAGSYIAQHSLFKALLNKPLVVLIRDNASQLYYQVGNEDFPAYIKADFSTGTTKDGSKGYAIDAASSGSAVIMYSGDVLISPDQVSQLLALMVDDIDILLDELDETIDTE